MKRIDGMTAVVTGGASGIGREMARALSARGVRLALLDQNESALDAVCEELGALALPCDIRDEPSVRAAAQRARRHLGTLDMLFANAGVAVAGPTCSVPLEDARWVLDVNVIGTLTITQHFVPWMKEQGRGHIAFTASIAGLVGAPGMAAYTASKFAVVGLAESLRVELEGTGVTVTTVCPGYVRTGLHRATRYTGDDFASFLDAAPPWVGLRPEDVARRAIEATLAGRPVAVIGVERLAVWLERLSPQAYSKLASRASRAAGFFR